MASEGDCSWMGLLTDDDAWQRGFDKFIEETFENILDGEFVQCPCSKCHCMLYHGKEEVEHHLVTKGFDKNFIIKSNKNVMIMLLNLLVWMMTTKVKVVLIMTIGRPPLICFPL